MKFTADFETTTQEDDCRVWAWAICDIENPETYVTGNSVNTFMEYLECSKESRTLYFHNLRFDAEFILVYLFEHGYQWVASRKELADKKFTTLISDKGQFYSMEIVFKRSGHKTKKVTIFDSLKIIPQSIDSIAKGFHLPEQKLKLNYDAFREPGHVLTEHEREYLSHDVQIAARALKYFFDRGLDKMTAGSNALSEYHRIIGEKKFKRLFPNIGYDRHMDMKPAYRGGYTYANPAFQGRDIGCGIVLDVNSLYPWVMYECILPYGEPLFFSGRYEPDKVYPLYIQRIRCQFELKEGFLPTIQLKNSSMFVATEYLTSSNEEDVVLTLTNIDLDLFLEHYDVYNLEYLCGYKFKGQVGMFKEYIDHWSSVKINSKKEGNHAMYIIAKLMLNSLYGKFATSPDVASKIPTYVDGAIKYQLPKETFITPWGTESTRTKYDRREPIYIPVGIFVTSHARNKTIRSAQKNIHRFLYADTDSLHLVGLEEPSELEIDDTKLGAWKHESTFVRARFLRAKTYIEDTLVDKKELAGLMKEMTFQESLNRVTRDKLTGLDTYLKITCAGLPSRCYKHVTWENFQYGTVYDGKLTPKHVKGGQVLVETTFQIAAG